MRDILIIALAQSAVCAAIALGALITVNDRPVIALLVAAAP